MQERARTDVLSTQSTSEPDVVNGINESIADASAVQVEQIWFLRHNASPEYISACLKIRRVALVSDDHLQSMNAYIHHS